MKALRIAVAATWLVAALALGCGSSGKGEESPLPDEGSSDSWRRPTEHGDITFGTDYHASFADDQLYHAWDFSLTAEAEVSVAVALQTPNLDTVMYLYYRAPGESGWGSYIARNDDYQGNIWSRVDKTLQPGDYRVMVKAYKEQLRGSFTFRGDCSGGGCPAVGGACSEEIDGLPSATGFGESCIGQLEAIFHTPSAGHSGFYVNREERCNQPTVVRLAWDYYYRYFADVGMDWADYHDEEWDGPLGFDISVERFGAAGTRIGVDFGGDEMGVSLVFDAQDRLLALFHSEQSSTYEFYCRAESEPASEEWYGEDCVYAYLHGAPFTGASPEQTGTVVAGDTSRLPALLADTVKVYARDEGLADNEPIAYTYVQFVSAESSPFFDLLLEADGHAPLRYYLGSGYEDYIFFVEGNESSTFVCETPADLLGGE